MKLRTYFGLALLFPFLLWGVCALVVYILSSKNIPDAWEPVLMPVFFYAFGIVLWFIPYSLIVVGMWTWSKNKSIKAVCKMTLIAPPILSVLIILEAVLMFPRENLADLANSLPGQAAVIVGFSLVFGYLCVGISFGLFRFLQVRHLITEEVSPQA